MSQPHLLEYICNVCHVFPQHIEIHRHVARCLANLALYGELLVLFFLLFKLQSLLMFFMHIR
jgi:hypothetical protein